MVKFIHTSDWHLGMQAHFLPDEARARFSEDRFDAVRQIAEMARREGCSFVVVAGDVFDSNHVDERVLLKASDALASFSVPVFLLPGNHDPFDGSSVYRRRTWSERKPQHAIVIEDVVPIAVPGVRGVEVVGAPWRTKRQLADPLCPADAVPISTGRPTRVVVGHGVVDELSADADDPALIRAGGIREALQEGKAHYVALGDRHSVTDISGAAGGAAYAGTPVSTDYGEVEPNEVLLVEIDGRECSAERRKVGHWRFERAVRDLASEEDVTALEGWLDSFASKHTTAVKLALRGTITLAVSAMLEEMLQRQSLTFALLNAWERQSDLVVAPDDADLAGLNVSGYVREALVELRDEASTWGEKADVARDALNLLYRLAR